MSKSGHAGKVAVEEGELFYNETGTLAVSPDKIRERLKQGKRLAEVYDAAFNAAQDAGEAIRYAQSSARQAVNDFLALWSIDESMVPTYYESSLAILKAYEDAYEFKLGKTGSEEAANNFALSMLKDTAKSMQIDPMRIVERFEQAKELKTVYDRGLKLAIENNAVDPEIIAMDRVKKHIKLWNIPNDNDVNSRMLVARAFYYTVDWDILMSLPWSFLEIANGVKLPADYRKKLIELVYYSRLAENAGKEWTIPNTLYEFGQYAKSSTWQDYEFEIDSKHLLMREDQGDELSEPEIDQVQRYRHHLAVEAEEKALREAQGLVPLEVVDELIEEIAANGTAEAVTEHVQTQLHGIPTDLRDEFTKLIQDAVYSTTFTAKDETIAALQVVVTELRAELERINAWIESAKREYQTTVDDYNALAEKHETLEREYTEYRQNVTSALQAARRGLSSFKDGTALVREGLKLLSSEVE